MEKQFVSASYDAATNTTRVYYEDNTFEAFPGNVVQEKAGITDEMVEEVMETEPTEPTEEKQSGFARVMESIGLSNQQPDGETPIEEETADITIETNQPQQNG